MTNRISTLLISLCLATTASLTGCEKDQPDGKPAATKDDKGKTAEADKGKPTPEIKAPEGEVKAPEGEVKAPEGDAAAGDPKAPEGDAPEGDAPEGDAPEGEAEAPAK